mmetsp:Transcript_54165/g.105977  ORF Transcript_54165/g.105977 Transcript_54165/m.105977 type:complete len:122 (+) Transcript_54165:1429-1794(+)
MQRCVYRTERLGERKRIRCGSGNASKCNDYFFVGNRLQHSFESLQRRPATDSTRTKVIREEEEETTSDKAQRAHWLKERNQKILIPPQKERERERNCLYRTNGGLVAFCLLGACLPACLPL